LAPRENPALLSIVAPVFNEEPTISHFVDRVRAVLEALALPFEIVLVNDGSTDGSLGVMDLFAEQDGRITVVNLSRNFGKETALTAGIAHAQGDAVLVLDADLQDPPELVDQLLAAYREGYDMIYGRRTVRHGETRMKKATARAFYRLMRGLGPVPLPENVGDFRLMSRRAVDVLMQLEESHRFMKGLFAWIGFPTKAIDYERAPRHSGETKWNYWKLINLSIEGVTSFTTLPLRISSWVGFTVALVSFVYGVWLLTRTLLFGDPVAGFPTLMLTLLFLGGAQLIALGVIGEYLGRVFNETKRRPLFIVESVVWSSGALDRATRKDEAK
jgi:glycosyltransferase involved in cell wall biosynthesis